MIQDNAIIHGRTVGAWKQLAQEYNQPHDTPEELGAFIERYEKADRHDYFHPLRQAQRNAEIHAEAQALLDELQRIQTRTTQKMTLAQLQFLEAELPGLEALIGLASQLSPKQ